MWPKKRGFMERTRRILFIHDEKLRFYRFAGKQHRAVAFRPNQRESRELMARRRETIAPQ